MIKNQRTYISCFFEGYNLIEQHSGTSQEVLVVKNLTANAKAGDVRDGFVPWVGKIPLQYSCLENPMDKKSPVGYSPWGDTESDVTEVT